MERCVTRRLAAASSAAQHLTTMESALTAVLLAKKIVHEAQRSGAARDRSRAQGIRTAIGRQTKHQAAPCHMRTEQLVLLSIAHCETRACLHTINHSPH